MALTDRRLAFLLLAAHLGAFTRLDKTYGPQRGDAILAYCTTEQTFEEVGQSFHVTGERARQYVTEGLEFLWRVLDDQLPVGASGHLLPKVDAIPADDLHEWPLDRRRVAHHEAALNNWDREEYIKKQRRAIELRQQHLAPGMPDANAQ